MKSVLFVLLFVSALITESQAQPKISFDKKRHNFGDVIYGSMPTTFFKFVNTGNEALILKKVNSSCGCTSPFWTRDSVQPGDSGFIKVVFNSRGYKNKDFAKSVFVQSNAKTNKYDNNDKMVVLYITGHVVPKDKFVPQYPVEVSTNMIRYGKIVQGKKYTEKFKIYNKGDSTLTVINIKQNAGLKFITKPEHIVIPPGDSITVNLIYPTKNANPGNFYDIFKLETNIPVKQTVNISEKGFPVSGTLITKEEAKQEKKKEKAAVKRMKQ